MEHESFPHDGGDIGAWSASSSLDIGTLQPQFEASQSDDSIEVAGASRRQSHNAAGSERHGIAASRVLVMGAHDDSFASTFRSEDSHFQSPDPQDAARSPVSALWDSPIVKVPGPENATSTDASPGWTKGGGTRALREDELIKGPNYSPLDLVNSSLSGFEDQVCLIRDYVEHNSSAEQERTEIQRDMRHDTSPKQNETPTQTHASKDRIIAGNARYASSLESELSSLSLHSLSNQQDSAWDAERKDRLGPMVSSASRSSFSKQGSDAKSFDAKMRELKHDLHQNSADLRDISAMFRKLDYEAKDVEATISDASFSVSRVVLASPYRSKRSDDWVDKLSQPRHTPDKIHNVTAKDKALGRTGSPEKKTRKTTGEGSTVRRKTSASVATANLKSAPHAHNKSAADAQGARKPVRYSTPTRTSHTSSSKRPLVCTSNQGVQTQPPPRNASPVRASAGGMTGTVPGEQPAVTSQAGDIDRWRHAAGNPPTAASSANGSVSTPEIAHRQKRTRSSTRTPDLRFDSSLDLDASAQSGMTGRAFTSSRTIESRRLMGSVNSAARWDALRQLARERGMRTGTTDGSNGSQKLPARIQSQAQPSPSPGVVSRHHPSSTFVDSARASQTSSASHRGRQVGAEEVDRSRAWSMNDGGDKWSIGPGTTAHSTSNAASVVGERDTPTSDLSDQRPAPDSGAPSLWAQRNPASITDSAQRSKQYAELFPAPPAELTALAREVALSLLAAADEVDDGSPVGAGSKSRERVARGARAAAEGSLLNSSVKPQEGGCKGREPRIYQSERYAALGEAGVEVPASGRVGIAAGSKELAQREATESCEEGEGRLVAVTQDSRDLGEDGGEEEEEEELYRRLWGFYKRFNPTRVKDAGRIAEEYLGREEVLNALLRGKYGQNLPAKRVSKLPPETDEQRESRQEMLMTRRILTHGTFFYGDKTTFRTEHVTVTPHHSTKMAPTRRHSEDESASVISTSRAPSRAPSRAVSSGAITPYRTPSRSRAASPAGRSVSGAQQPVTAHRGSRASSPAGSRIEQSNTEERDGSESDEWPHADDVMDWSPEDVVLFLQARMRGKLGPDMRAGLLARSVDGAKLLGRGAVLARTEIGVKSAREWALLMQIVEQLRTTVGAGLL